MRMCIVLSVFVLLVLFVFGVRGDIRGVKQSDEDKYSGATMICADPIHGSRTIPISLLNDDYCDCPYDGVDEPATGACQAGKFYCANKGWRGKYVYASAVNDGVCDCCDGSDEWRSGACRNTCEELGKASTIHLEEKLNKILTGVKIRNDLINDAKLSRKEREERKIQLEATFAERHAIVDSLKKKVEEEEQLEKEENEKREKAAAEAAAAAAPAQPSTTDPHNPMNDKPSPGVDNAATESSPSTPSIPPPSSSDNIAVSGGDDDEEEGGSRFTRKRKNSKKSKKETPSIEQTPIGEAGGVTPTTVIGEEKIEAEVAAFPYPAEYAYQPNAATNHEEAERMTEEKEDEEDDEAEADEASKEANNYAAANNYVSEAAKQARAALEAAEKKLERTRVKLEEAKNLLETDFGPDDQFFSLYKACFSLPHKQYTYEMCPYEDAKQKEHTATSLGSWASHTLKDINGKKTFVFSFNGGQGCWQGPSRSLDVHIHCGDFNKVLSVEEPSKCVYLMQFESPTVCTAEEVNAVQTEIENAKKGLDE